MLERTKNTLPFRSTWTPCVLLGAGVALLGCAIFWESPSDLTAWSIVGGGLLSIVLTIAWAITTSDVTLRWATLSLAALMLLGMSALSIDGLGLFTAPVGIVLLAFCLFKLILGRTKSA